jgi:Spherulation-specific family 4
MPARGPRSARRRWARAGRPWLLVLLAAIALTLTGGIAGRYLLAAGPACQEALIPAYFYPGPTWTRAIDSKPVPGVMILDITSSGAGSSPDRNYQVTVKRARAAGIKVLGYSNTDYTQRPAAAVRADVRHYRSWYGVTDIFLDEVSSDRGGIRYYRQLAGYVHGMDPGSTVMLNPGLYPDRQYMSIGDIVMVYENTYAGLVGLQVPRWAANYPASKFAYAIYATSGAQLASALSLAEHRNAGYVYVTASSGSNPYASLPAYWPREEATLAGQCSTGRDSAARRDLR